MFRSAGPETYYLALVSSKGYFRLDAVNNNIPRPLIGWTEAPGLHGDAVTLGIIAKGDHFILLINGKWAAETHDSAIPGGHLGFALVSYDSELTGGYTCQSRLNFLSVNSRAGAVEAEYRKWHDNAEINAESRFRLAESLAVLDYFGAAYYQILKAWKQREESAKSVTATYTETRTRGEFLFAAQMASRAGEYAAAEEYIEAYLAMGIVATDELTVIAEKAQILSAQNKDEELAAFLTGHVKKYDNIPSLYALLGHAFWNLKQYKKAGTAWNKAYRLDRNNGLYEELKKKAEKKNK
jgi:tetratricopeptide (TPR) repeat protein